jgi:hypothetical protein
VTGVPTASVPGGWLYDLMVLLHVICAIGAFGALAYRGLVLSLARQRGDAAQAGVLSVYGQVSQVGELLLYGVGVFGAAAIGAAGHSSYFHRAWVVAALAVFAGMVAILHGALRPAERRYRAILLELAKMPGTPPPRRPPQLAQLEGLTRRIGAATGVFNVLLLGALYLMVYKP